MAVLIKSVFVVLSSSRAKEGLLFGTVAHEVLKSFEDVQSEGAEQENTNYGKKETKRGVTERQRENFTNLGQPSTVF